MACMGPSKESAYKKGAEAFKEVVELLEKKYGLNRAPCNLPYGFSQRMRKEWVQQKCKLRRAIQEMLWIDDCDSW